MNAALARLLAGLIATAALVVVGSHVHPRVATVHHSAASVAPVLSAAAVCPSVTGGPAGSFTDMTVAVPTGATPTPRVSYAPLAPGSGTPTGLTPSPAAVVSRSTPYGAVSVQANGPGAGAVTVSQVALSPTGLRRGLTDLACSAPATDWWFAGADGRIGVTDVLVLANTANASANVDLHLWSARGPLSPPGATGLTVPAHTSVLRKIADLAPDVASIAVHVHANTGTVAAAILDQRTSGIRPFGADWIPATAPPSTAPVVTGFVAGATTDWLHLVNPGDRDATVSLRVLTTSRNFEPAGHQSVVVPAGHALTVDLSTAVGGETAAVAVHSDAPVAAAGMTLIRPAAGFSELAWLAAQPPLTGPAGIAANSPPFGQQASLVLTAPAGTEDVRVSTPAGAKATVTVPAGRSVKVDLLALLHASPAGPGPILLTPVEDQPVFAVRVLYAVGAHGPLLAAEAPSVLPQAATLPAVTPDLRAATG